MAGQYFEFLSPGYSELWTRDHAYVPGTGEAADLNPFAPRSSARPLIEGEWLQHAAPPAGASGHRVTRGGNNAVSVSGTPDGEGTVPAFPYWMEEGRFDVQTKKRAHIVIGPAGFEFRTRLCDTTFNSLAVNDAVSVWDLDFAGGTVVRRILAKRNAGHGVGWVTRIYGPNDIAVFYTQGAT